jgi:hypothetical protein
MKTEQSIMIWSSEFERVKRKPILVGDDSKEICYVWWSGESGLQHFVVSFNAAFK